VAQIIAQRATLAAQREAAVAAEADAQRAVTEALSSGVGDVDALETKQQRAALRLRNLETALAELDAAIPEAREAAGLQLARAFVEGSAATAKGALRQIEAAQAESQRVAEQLTAVLQREEAARAVLGALPTWLKVLATRFPGLAIPVLLPAPGYLDVLREPLAVTMKPTKRVRFEVLARASADAAERRRNAAAALRTFLDGRTLPPEIAAIFALAGVPEPEVDTRTAQIMEAAEAQALAEEREVARVAGELEARRAIPHTSGGGFR
jgi:hypothetical protein